MSRYCLWDKSHIAVVPNAHFFTNEADVLSVTKARLAHVFEIKISRSDLKADFKKDRHKELVALKQHYNSYGKRVWLIPSYFWFVAPEPVFQGITIPAYAGIMVPHKHKLRVVRKAPRLHTEKLSDQDMVRVLDKLLWRYWRTRWQIS